MGDVFSLGFGPFRWVCSSGRAEDLATTDQIAYDVLAIMEKTAAPRVAAQLRDNMRWVKAAHSHRMVVGSQVGSITFASVYQ
jgi:urocanate hydratase